MTAQNFTVDNGITVNGSGGNITGATNIVASGNLTVHDATLGGNINAAGNFDLDGNASIGGNLFVTGNINFSGNVTQISGNSGVFYGNATTGVGALYAGKTGYTALPNTVVQVTGDDNSYVQVNLQNTNHGNTASMELAITADDGTDTTNYLDIGIAGSTWDGTQDNSLGTAVSQRDGYLYVQGGAAGGNLILGTSTAGYNVKINAGGPGSANTVAQFSSTGLSLTGSVTATNIGNVAALNLNGNASTVLYGNGVFSAVAAGSTYGDSNVVTLLSSFGSNVLSTTGNITGGNLVISGVTSLAGNITSNGYFISGNQATGGFKLGNVNSRIAVGGGNSYMTFSQNPSIYPDTALSASAGLLIGGGGYILAPNGSRVITLGTDGSLGVTSNINAVNGGIISTTGNVNAGNLNVTGSITRSGNFAQASWTTAGIGLKLPTATYNETTAPGGTVAASYIHTMASPTLIASNATTYTNYATFFVAAPTLSTNVTVTNNWAMISNGSISVAGNVVGNTAGYTIGYRDVPQVSFTGNATMAATDAGKHYYSTLSTANVLTIANNTSVGWAVGTAISVVNRGTGNITIAQDTGVSLYLAGNSTAGNRTVTTYGMATLLNVAANVWMINGTGVS